MVNKTLGVDIKLDGVLSWTEEGLADIGVTQTNDLSLIDDISVVRQALAKRLNTRKGGLWAHPEYGCRIWDILSELMSDTWFIEATAAIRECINDEPRAETVKVTYDVSHENRMVIFTIVYRVVGDGRQDNLVWRYNPEAVVNSV